LGGRSRRISEFEASLVYRVPGQPEKKKPVLKNKTKQTNKQTKNPKTHTHTHKTTTKQKNHEIVRLLEAV
jgi:hypothetical protein